MKVDGGLSPNIEQVPASVKKLEAMGFDGAISVEMGNDPFFPLLLAAEHSEKIELRTGIAVAFARSPMILANIGNDLNAYSKGRFTLGLGSQIRPHITKRFSMPWGAPVPQMRELIQAMRAIWDNWYNGAPLAFTGKYYTHTLMTPTFTPLNTQYGPPSVHLGAVGPLMTQLAGEVADGMMVHPFSHEKYIREFILPNIEKGLLKSGRKRKDFEISFNPMVISGNDEKTVEASKAAARKMFSFYGSTPAYKEVLVSHGWGDLHPRLNTMSKQGKWREMCDLIPDEMLNTIGIMGSPEEIVPEIKRRYGDIIDRTSGDFKFVDDEQRAEMIAQLGA